MSTVVRRGGKLPPFMTYHISVFKREPNYAHYEQKGLQGKLNNHRTTRPGLINCLFIFGIYASTLSEGGRQQKVLFY
jgi:hypothetical protein